MYTVSPQAHGIHPPRKLIFFSKVLEKLIWKVWRKGPFSRVKEKKGENGSRERGQGEAKAVVVKERFTGQERRQEDYESSQAAMLWELGKDWRGNPWQRVKSFFREMSAYEQAGENGFNAK